MLVFLLYYILGIGRMFATHYIGNPVAYKQKVGMRGITNLFPSLSLV